VGLDRNNRAELFAQELMYSRGRLKSEEQEFLINSKISQWDVYVLDSITGSVRAFVQKYSILGTKIEI